MNSPTVVEKNFGSTAAVMALEKDPSYSIVEGEVEKDLNPIVENDLAKDRYSIAMTPTEMNHRDPSAGVVLGDLRCSIETMTHATDLSSMIGEVQKEELATDQNSMR